MRRWSSLSSLLGRALADLLKLALPACSPSFAPTEDTPLAQMWAGVRTLRYADVRPSPSRSSSPSRPRARTSTDPSLSLQGPDEVHLDQLGRTELKRLQVVQDKYNKIDNKEKNLRGGKHSKL